MERIFTQEDPWFERHEMTGDVETITFHHCSEAIDIRYMPISVKYIYLYFSPFVKFFVPCPYVEYVYIDGSVYFDDAMFNLRRCAIKTNYPYVNSEWATEIEPGQLKIKNTETVELRRCKLHPNCLDEVDANRIVFDTCDFIPNIPDTIHELHLNLPDISPIHLPNISHSLKEIRVPIGQLSENSLRRIHDHNQRRRFLNRHQLSIYDTTGEIVYLFYNGNLLDFTIENRQRDRTADRIRLDLYSNQPPLVASNILQYLYGDHYQCTGGKRKKRTIKKLLEKAEKKIKSRR